MNSLPKTLTRQRRDCDLNPGSQLPSQPLRGLVPISLLDEQKHDGCEQFAYDCYPTARISSILLLLFRD